MKTHARQVKDQKRYDKIMEAFKKGQTPKKTGEEIQEILCTSKKEWAKIGLFYAAAGGIFLLEGWWLKGCFEHRDSENKAGTNQGRGLRELQYRDGVDGDKGEVTDEYQGFMNGWYDYEAYPTSAPTTISMEETPSPTSSIESANGSSSWYTTEIFGKMTPLGAVMTAMYTCARSLHSQSEERDDISRIIGRLIKPDERTVTSSVEITMI